MSRIIKASRITGEYVLEENKLIIKTQDKTETDDSETIIEKDQIIEEKTKIMVEAEKTAADIIDEAKKEAVRIKEQAQQEAAQLAESAKENGFEQGYQEGLTAGREAGKQEIANQLTTVINQLENVVLQVREELIQQTDSLTGDLIGLSTRIATKIINAELEVNPQAINHIIYDMVEDMANFEEINIMVHPDLEKYIVKDDFKSDFAKQQLNFIPDNNLEVGDCIVTSPFGGRDGTLETKLALVENELLKGAGVPDGV